MVKTRYLIIIFLILLLGIFLFKYIKSGEGKKVKKAFKLLSNYVEKKPDEDLFSSMNRIKNISRLFLEPCVFKIEEDPLYCFSGHFTRDEIGGYALRGRSYFLELSLEFDDFKIEFPDRETAHVLLRGRLTGKSKIGENIEEVRQLLCILKKVENNWLFQHFEVNEILKK